MITTATTYALLAFVSVGQNVESYVLDTTMSREDCGMAIVQMADQVELAPNLKTDSYKVTFVCEIDNWTALRQ